MGLGVFRVWSCLKVQVVWGFGVFGVWHFKCFGFQGLGLGGSGGLWLVHSGYCSIHGQKKKNHQEREGPTKFWQLLPGAVIGEQAYEAVPVRF